LVDENDLLLTIAQEPQCRYLAELERFKVTAASQSKKSTYAISLQNIQQSLKKLSNEGFIKVVESRVNQDKPFIELTLWGLLRVLDCVLSQELADDTLKEQLDKIVFNQGKKLLPFMFYPYFTDREIAIEAIQRFLNFNNGRYQSSEQCLIDKFASYGFNKMTKKEIETMTLESFYDFFFLIAPEDLSVSEGRMNLWNKALAKDEETKRFVVERICHYKDRFAPKVEKANQRIRFFGDIQHVV
jgi:DNA-binding HxlR family transcriptional regulator